MADASDRIREHRERKEKLEVAAEEARGLLAERRQFLDTADTIAAFAAEMSEFLKTSELTETKAFVGSFVKEVVVKPGRAAIVYSIPTPEDSPIGGADAAEIALNGRVMNSVRHGGPGATGSTRAGSVLTFFVESWLVFQACWFLHLRGFRSPFVQLRLSNKPDSRREDQPQDEYDPPVDAYYERWYRPDLMAVVAVGDFDVEDIEAKVKQYFAPPPEGEAGQKRAAAGPTTDRPLVEVPGHEIPLIEVFTDPESPATQSVLIRKLDPETGRDLAAFRRTVVERLAFMMLNARLFERGQSAEPPYINSSAGRSAYVETLDIATFSAWVETDGVEAGLAAMLEEIQRAHQHSFTAGELEREKSNLLSSVESQYKQRAKWDCTANF